MDISILRHFLAGALVLFCVPAAHAETVEFVSGRKTEAHVIKSANAQVTLEINGSLASYSLSEIATIDGKPAAGFVPAGEPAQAQPSPVAAFSEKATLGIASVYLDKKMYDEAISEYSKAIERNPSLVEAYYNRGLAYSKKEDYERAIADYSKVIALNPGDADSYYNRGLARYKKKDIDAAIEDYTKTIEINPRAGDVFYNRALAYLARKEYGKVWDDVHAAESAGYQISADFLAGLRKVSKREN